VLGPDDRRSARSVPNLLRSSRGSLSPDSGPARSARLLREQEGFSGAPYLIIYRGRAILIHPPRSPAKCHGGIKHCLPIGAVRSRVIYNAARRRYLCISVRRSVFPFCLPSLACPRPLDLTAASARSTNPAKRETNASPKFCLASSEASDRDPVQVRGRPAAECSSLCLSLSLSRDDAVSL
jgi:hypothetical protein